MAIQSVASDYLQAEADLKKAHDRQVKATRIKHIGDPIELPGKVIRCIVRGNSAWTAESGGVARRIDLQLGKTAQVFRGHTAPVTCLALHHAAGRVFLITGGWDRTIKIWDTTTKAIVATIVAHGDFLKSLVVIPSLNILVSGSSDKTLRLWDLTRIEFPSSPLDVSSVPQSLLQIGSLSDHTRPVDCLALDLNGRSELLYSADSMGVIKAWELDILTRQDGTRSVRGNVNTEWRAHRTGVNELWVSDGNVWSASTDSSIMLHTPGSAASSPIAVPASQIPHPNPVRSLLPLSLFPSLESYPPILITGSADTGILRFFDTVSFGEKDGVVEEAAQSLEGHSHDITGMGWWIRDRQKEEGQTSLEKKSIKELWIVTASLDGTIRRWRMNDILSGTYQKMIRESFRYPNGTPAFNPQSGAVATSAGPTKDPSEMTEEELDDLLAMSDED